MYYQFFDKKRFRTVSSQICSYTSSKNALADIFKNSAVLVTEMLANGENERVLRRVDVNAGV